MSYNVSHLFGESSNMILETDLSPDSLGAIIEQIPRVDSLSYNAISQEQEIGEQGVGTDTQTEISKQKESSIEGVLRNEKDENNNIALLMSMVRELKGNMCTSQMEICASLTEVRIGQDKIIAQLNGLTQEFASMRTDNTQIVIGTPTKTQVVKMCAYSTDIEQDIDNQSQTLKIEEGANNYVDLTNNSLINNALVIDEVNDANILGDVRVMTVHADSQIIQSVDNNVENNRDENNFNETINKNQTIKIGKGTGPSVITIKTSQIEQQVETESLLCQSYMISTDSEINYQFESNQDKTNNKDNEKYMHKPIIDSSWRNDKQQGKIIKLGPRQISVSKTKVEGKTRGLKPNVECRKYKAPKHYPRKKKRKKRVKVETTGLSIN